MQISMWNLIKLVNRSGVVLVCLCTLFLSCTKKTERNEGEVKTDISVVQSYSYKGMLNEFFDTLDVSILERKKNCIIIFDYDPNEYTVYGGMPKALRAYRTKQKYFSVDFVNKDDRLDKGCAVLFFTHIKKDVESQTYDSYLIDVKYIPAKEGYCVYEHFLCYGLGTDGTCSEDEERYGFTLIPIGGWLPYDKKVIPDYILSFTETKMIFEEPSDNKYFLYQSSNFDGI